MTDLLIVAYITVLLIMPIAGCFFVAIWWIRIGIAMVKYFARPSTPQKEAA